MVDGLAERGVIVRAGTALGQDGLDARDLRHAARRTIASSQRWIEVALNLLQTS